MRVCLSIYLITLLPIAVLLKENLKPIISLNKRKAIEARQNIWELGDEFEGDILVDTRRNVIRNESCRWFNNTVPYEFDSIYDARQRQWILDSLTEITNNSCVKTRLRTKADKDYIFITEIKKGCSSFIGKRGGQQILKLERAELGQGCFRTSTIIHEFMHVLGFSHQQSVYNRDKYIKINYENIKKGKEKNFMMLSDDELSTLGEEYDYESIMHYSCYAYTKNGKMTIEAKNSSIAIRKTTRLSKIDIRKLNKVYQCNNQ